MKRKIGIHASVRKGFLSALKEAEELGCGTIQMFTQSPRGWKTRNTADAEFEQFRSARRKSGITPLAVHAPYLPNLCTSDTDLYEKSVRWLKSDLARCEKMGADHLVIHPGAYSPDSTHKEGIKRIVGALNTTFRDVKGHAMILIENMAGGGRRIGSRFEEISDILNGVEEKNRLGVCFDTCHAYGAGYDVSTSTGVEGIIREFDRHVGLDRIRLFHVNDSKSPLASHKDRHEHLGEGCIGKRGLGLLLSHPQFNECGFILETPKNPPGSDKKNLAVLSSLVER